MTRASNQDAEALRNLQSFNANWYLDQYPDVKLLGMDPLEHYLWIGKRLGRKPSEDFPSKNLRDSSSQLNPAANALAEVRSAPMGIEEARQILDEVFSRKGGSHPRRMYNEFDAFLADQFTIALLLMPGLDEKANLVKVSVIMPTYNRGSKIANAIDSVLRQSHKNLELIIVDDGSDDETPSVLESYKHDPRVRILVNNHGGVSKARNTGLTNASGEIVFYLDSDNAWTPDFVQVMTMSLLYTGASCAYGASRIQDHNDHLVGYRGEPFNWDSCVRGNYVDMNVFCHRRFVTDESGKFDETLKRMVDWDLILRYTKERGAIYCPTIGCLYLDDGVDLNRITTSQPYLFRKIVHEKNLNSHATTAEALAAVRLKFALKIAAPFEARAAWGDFHFAESLKSALEAAGHEARIDFLGTWYNHPSNADDVAIALRGLTEYKPISGQLSLLWNISHPDQVSYEEYERFHGIFVASEAYADLLSLILQRNVRPLLQCTDKSRFSLESETTQGELDDERPGVFVGNSRKTYRQLVRWSVENGVKVDVYGQHWETFIPSEMVKGINVDNKELSKTYRRAKFVLNDHWESMRDFGFISNRIFDVVGCGGRLISDYIPTLPGLMGGTVNCVRDEQDFRVQMKSGLPAISFEDRRQASKYIHDHHSFDTRVNTILNWIDEYITGTKRPQPRLGQKALAHPIGQRKKVRVGLLLQRGKAWPTSSAFIRLIAPLTTDAAHLDVEVIELENVQDSKIDSIDKIIVQRIAVPDHDQAEKLLARLKSRNAPLFVDTDDAFFLHEAYRNEDRVLRRLMAKAQESWFSTAVLADYYHDIPGIKRVIPNSLDPRFWRNYRQPVSTSFSNDKVRFLYMGTATHDQDFDLVYPILKELSVRHPGRFNLTIIGAVRKPPNETWIRRLGPPAGHGSYPKFVRWLMANNCFDAGIAPLQDSPFNRAKSDVKFLDYSALGLLSLVSDGPAYHECIHNELAIGCVNQTDWINNLNAVIESPSKFEPMRKKAHEHVWGARSTLNGINLLAELLGDAATIDNSLQIV